MQNSVVLFTFPAFDWKYPFGANFILEVEVWYLEFSNMQNSSVVHFFPILTRYNLFGEIWSQKPKIVSSSWNLVPWLIQKCRIHYWYSLFQFLARKSFLGKFGQKNKIVSLSWNLVCILTRICKIQWWCSFFLIYTRNTLFGQIWSRKSKLLV